MNQSSLFLRASSPSKDSIQLKARQELYVCNCMALGKRKAKQIDLFIPATKVAKGLACPRYLSQLL